MTKKKEHSGIESVRLTGLEPAHRKTPDPKSGASTNFATGAKTQTWQPCRGKTQIAGTKLRNNSQFIVLST